MARLSIQLPEDLHNKAAARASEAGHASVEQYLESLLRADLDAAGENYGAPEHVTVRSDDEAEAVLLRRLESTEPGIEATPEFWARLEAEAKARRGARAAR